LAEELADDGQQLMVIPWLLHIGLQVVAPMWEDGTAIEFAALLSDRGRRVPAPPAFAVAIGD